MCAAPYQLCNGYRRKMSAHSPLKMYANFTLGSLKDVLTFFFFFF